jgi:hypothetical protein
VALKPNFIVTLVAVTGQLKTSGAVIESPGASVAGADGTPLASVTFELPLTTVTDTVAICAFSAPPLPAFVIVTGTLRVPSAAPSVRAPVTATASAGSRGVKLATRVSGPLTVTMSGLLEVVGTLPLKFAKA